jgi:hypothetical protein
LRFDESMVAVASSDALVGNQAMRSLDARRAGKRISAANAEV